MFLVFFSTRDAAGNNSEEEGLIIAFVAFVVAMLIGDEDGNDYTVTTMMAI